LLSFAALFLKKYILRIEGAIAQLRGNKQIVLLTRAIIENPDEGVGKPEPLKYELSGYWS